MECAAALERRYGSRSPWGLWYAEKAPARGIASVHRLLAMETTSLNSRLLVMKRDAKHNYLIGASFVSAFTEH
jgi:hypothetical protein